MPEPDHAATLHQVLADPTGRRRRRLVIAGRVATTVLGLWLVMLILGGLGLQPLAGIPIVGDLGADGAAPPALPDRVRSAAAKRTTVAPAPRARVPATTGPGQSRRRQLTTPSPAKTRPQARQAPTTTPRRAGTTPNRAPLPATPAPSRPTPNGTTTAPGQTRTPPGQTKTAPGPPTTTPGTTPHGKGNPPGAKAR
jgi:hypothetical protein